MRVCQSVSEELAHTLLPSCALSMRLPSKLRALYTCTSTRCACQAMSHHEKRFLHITGACADTPGNEGC